MRQRQADRPTRSRRPHAAGQSSALVRCGFLVWCAVVVMSTGHKVLAEDAEGFSGRMSREMSANARSLARARTFGVLQFWLDLQERSGWKIQRHAETDDYRLIDPSYKQVFTGDLEACRAELETRVPAAEQSVPEQTIILLHGYVRSSSGLEPVARRLEDAGYHVVCFNYPSRYLRIEQSAEGLVELIRTQTARQKIHLVAHSLGGLVCRAALEQSPRDPRLSRLVMLGTPNHGAELADKWRDVPLMEELAGPVGRQLLTGPGSFTSNLAVPPIEFGIIMGGKGNERGFSQRVPGDDDGTVSVNSARLEGARDMLLLNLWHPMLLYDEQSIDATLHFLEHGHFPRP